MSSEARELISALREAFERIARKAQPLLEDPALLDTETGRDLLDVICREVLPAVVLAIRALEVDGLGR